MKTAGWVAVSAASLAGGLAAWWVVKNSRLCAEKARYATIERDGAFELREYETLRLAGTPVDDEHDSFMRLFGYISGENHARREIAMTTPVLIAEERGQRTMNFVLPASVAPAAAPRPTSLEIEPAMMRGGAFAVYRYSGISDLLVESGNAAVLRTWMREQGLEPAGEAVVALYDPPWVPGPLRRNEILLRIAEG